ncbi:MAG: adenosine kinase [Chloroflexi bacterium]|nr:adenosine kinase [Chloroflexota bacterium]
MNKEENILKDVVGIGNAMVDILAPADEAFLAKHNMPKGGMTLVESPQAAVIYEAMGPGVEMSGGSVGNTMAGLASLGGTGSYIGKVHNDQLGGIFHHDLESLGITFRTAPALDSSPTARCLVIVTPDGQRSMATYLGACVELGPEDVGADTIRNHRVTYLEGYLWDAPLAKEAMLKAAKLAHDAGRQVALTLSDPFCVDRHRESFRDLILNHVDILFANEQEIISLYREENVHAALERGRGDCNLVAVTRSAEGSLIATSDMVHQVNAVSVERVVDTTGAGDLYAAGFLFGITHGYDIATSGRIGAIAAGEIISHVGARPEADLQELVRRTL